MDTNLLIEKVITFMNKNYKDVRVINIPNDIVYYFESKPELYLARQGSYTDFLTEIMNFIHKEDVNNYINALSLNSLEQEYARNGIVEKKVKYRRLLETGEYRWFVNIISYIEVNNQRLVFMMSEDIQDRLMEEELKTNALESEIDNYKERLESESESMANALLQVNNILEQGSNADGVLQMKDTRSYINSVFNNASLSHPELNQALVNKMTESSNFKKSSILIADDSSIIRNSLKRIFENDYNIVMAKDGNEAIKIIQDNVTNAKNDDNGIKIVGILLDLLMPNADGFVVLNYLKNFNLFSKIPVAIISGDETAETRKKVYEYEIVDMLEKPFNTDTIRMRISKIINLYMSSNDLQNIVLNQNKNNDIENDDIANDLSFVINQIVDNIVNNDNSQKIKNIADQIANNLMTAYSSYNLNFNIIDSITNTCALYNIGSIAIKNNEQMTMATVKKEIDYGLSILESYANDNDKEIGKNIIKYSCELYNGKGYPNGLSGNDIPIEAQITNIAVRLSKCKSLQTGIKAIIENESEKYNPDIISILNKIKK